MEQSSLSQKMKQMLSGKSIIPEAQLNTFKKYLATLDLKSGEQESALIHTCNSLGAQLRSDIKFILSDRVGDALPDAPVLNMRHIQELTDFDDLTTKLKELPSEWTIVQLSREFDPADVIGLNKEHRNADPTIVITRMACGEKVASILPYFMRLPPPDNIVTGPNIMERLIELLKARREFFANERDKKLRNIYINSDSAIASCLTEMETYWLREWRFLLQGRLVDFNLENELVTRAGELMEDVTSKTCRDERKCQDILFQLSISAHLLKPIELMKALKVALYDDQDCAGDPDQLAILMDDIKSINNRFASALKKADRHPVILITEPSLELFPWEMTTVLTGHPVSRILSIHLLYALFKYHEPNIINGYRQLPVSSAYCLLNPDQSLVGCEKQIGEFLRKDLPWVNVEAGSIPDPDQLLTNLSNHRVFMYCGHGSATQYFKFGAIKKALVNGLVLLYGCSSNLPRGRGGRTPYQNDTYTYLTNGCPCIIGAIYDITSSDADRASIKTISSMLPTVTNNRGAFTITNPVEPNVLRAVLRGKGDCCKFWSKCCFAARGIPVSVVCGESEKAEILKQLKR